MKEIEVTLLEVMGSDQAVADCAWVSSARGSGKDAAKMIERLSKEGHETPFEHCVLRFWIRAPQRIQVQVLRHRIATHSVASARYNHKFDTSYDFIDQIETEGNDISQTLKDLNEASKTCIELYNKVLEETIFNPNKKRIRELVAMALPQGTMSEQILTINMRSLRNFFRLRESPHAQPEIQYIAELMKEKLGEIEDIENINKFFLGI